jgi:putative hydrolase of the HAD superfamily
MGQPSPARVLMVGDNPKTDIAGAAAQGLATCWYNPGAR